MRTAAAKDWTDVGRETDVGRGGRDNEEVGGINRSRWRKEWRVVAAIVGLPRGRRDFDGRSRFGKSII